MAFIAECTFCHVMLRGVPDNRVGSITECPRCHSSFTLAPMISPPAAALAGPSKVQATKTQTVTSAIAVNEPPPTPPAGLVEAAPARPTSPVLQLEETVPIPARPQNREAVGERPVRAVPRRAALRRLPNYPGLASFLLGSFAFLAAAVLHLGLLTLALGFIGLLLGLLGLVFSSIIHSRRALSLAGLAVCLPALVLPILLPDWLGLAPLWGPRKPPDHGANAAIALSGGSLRRAPDGEPAWVDASRDALLHGDVRLRVSSARAGAADFEPVLGRETPVERCLTIGLRLTNAGVLSKLPYSGWSGRPQTEDQPVLRDNQGKTYPEKTFQPVWVVRGRAKAGSIPSGKFLDEVLVFEAPPATIKYLRLELPASVVGGQGQLQMEIPRHMVFFR